MTLLLSWLGVDSRAPSSIYIASDSRITWNNSNKWDYGRKIFGFRNSPDILGYCGDAFFPTQVLSQIVDIGDKGLLFEKNANSKDKFEAIKEKLIRVFNSYPYDDPNILGNNIVILHASRDKNANFFCHKIEWNRNNGWHGEKAEFHDHSDKLLVLGSGKREFLEKYQKYWESSNKKTSRAVFHCFCDTLSNINDKYCGGAPQLIGLYRINNPKPFGIIKENRRYLLGMDVTNLINLNNVEWRNELFERCDGITLKRLPGAQKQPNPIID